MIKPSLQQIVDNWRLPDGGSLLDRIERMIKPAVMGDYFRSSSTAIVCGLQYHLGGKTDTLELARLASITSTDHVLDVCCYLGGPAVQLAESFQCGVIGVDIAEGYVAAAKRIAELTELSHLVDYRVADAVELPCDNGQFTVVWNQCSLNHDEAWLREFDRVLSQGGRLAFTFEIRGDNPDEHSPKWKLQDVVGLLQNLGYHVEHVEDITKRDIEIGWKDLDRKLTEEEEEFVAILGIDWVHKAHEEFSKEIQRMQEGKWGNGRIVATKT